MPNKHKPHPARTEQTAPGGIVPLMLGAVRGTLIACLVGALLLLAVTAIAYAQDDPDQLTATFGYAVAALVALTAGFLASRRNRRAVLLCGLFSAACLLLIFAALTLIPVHDPSPATPAVSLALHAALLPLAVAGAYLGRRRQRR
ncbi:MAG: TIGR04086 family membrane protein [Clostridia bacterium]|nr:TIGR04086 family membrane protein [Clostridia bacterium]